MRRSSLVVNPANLQKIERFTCFHLFRSSNAWQKEPPEVFCKKGILRNFAKLTGKHLCQIPFLNKVAEACHFIKKETLAQTGVLLRILRNFQEHFFSQITSGGCFWETAQRKEVYQWGCLHFFYICVVVSVKYSTCENEKKKSLHFLPSYSLSMIEYQRCLFFW